MDISCVELGGTYCLPSRTEPSITPLYAQSQAALIPSDAYLQKRSRIK